MSKNQAAGKQEELLRESEPKVAKMKKIIKNKQNWQNEQENTRRYTARSKSIKNKQNHEKSRKSL